VKRQDPTDDDRPAFYAYARQERHFLPTLANHFLIRTARDPALALPAARRAIADVSPQLVVTSMTTMSSRVEQSLAEERFRATLAAVFGTSARVLAAVGLYGLAARRVADRRREFGVRTALGARPRDVRRLVVRDAALIVSLGLAAGLPAAVAAAQVASSLLFGVTPTAPHVFAAAAVALGVVAAAATALPARRASRIDPVHVLKQ
jgi:ABC-type antimicrobial peptide transport system permease subunit